MGLGTGLLPRPGHTPNGLGYTACKRYENVHALGMADDSSAGPGAVLRGWRHYSE